jgi:hypothetical protein
MTKLTATTTTPTAKKPRGSHTPRQTRQLNVYITDETSALLKAILERDGVPYSAQVNRAVRLWAEHKGIEVPHAKTGSTQ